MPGQHSPQKSVFVAAIEIASAAERAAFLDEACKGNPPLRAEVESLLRAHESPQPILDAAKPGVPTIDEPFSERSGTLIGPYKLLQQIGQGGMGTVFMAEQTQPVQRKVALKIINPGMDSRQVIARFEAERQALAMMDHPNIAKVLDAGTMGSEPRTPESGSASPLTKVRGSDEPGSGRPYFVMELVKGVAITQFCDDHHLTPRERLELFLPVCHAVQHAHQKGIIHRDLKPSNVLVALYDDKPVPKIIDFGVAKATGPKLTDRTMFTQFGQMVGTLEYMSPEQASFNALDIDTRSDIYSLGVLLYELLTGTTPLSRKRLKEAAFDEMLRIIREEEPPKPSTRLSTTKDLPSIAACRKTEPAKLGRIVKGDLDWIVMKSLEKDRTRRYETANGLAMDLKRYLADEVVTARSPSSWYRFRKFFRRNKGPVMVSVGLALVMIVGIGAVLGVQAKADRDRAAAEIDRAAREGWTSASAGAAICEARERAEEAWGMADYPDRMQRATDAAVAALHRADEFTGGGTPDEATLTKLASTHQVVEELAQHTRLITSAAHNQQKFAEELTGQNAYLAMAGLCNRQAEVLRQFGLDPFNKPADEVARAVAASRIRDALLGMLLEWHSHAAYLSEAHKKFLDPVPTSSASNELVTNRLGHVIRSARQLCGGAYVRWQDLLDRNDVPGLVAFAASPDALTFRSILVGALGRDLKNAKEYSACLTFLRAAVDRYPHDIWLHADLHSVCMQMVPPDPAEALRHMSASSVQRPESALFHLQLGFCYSALRSHDHAVAAFRKSASLSPDSAIAYEYMGHSLMTMKDWEGALTAYLKTIRLKPAWAQDPRKLLRYNAACAAINCADGKGANAPPPAERASYRKQALEFLTADLTAIRKIADADRAFVWRKMQHWLGDVDLASVRDSAAVEMLPPDERDAWNRLWADIRDLRDRTGRKGGTVNKSLSETP